MGDILVDSGKLRKVMVFSPTPSCPYPKMSCVQSQIKLKNKYVFFTTTHSDSSPPLPYSDSVSAPSSSSGGKISPAVLFIIVILAVVFFISGLLHLLVRFLIKHRSSSSVSESNRFPELAGSDTVQRQLQQLFNLHDSGLDQAFIDALPVFLYKEIMGLKEPFDCAVCLCEFSEQDKLRLLPNCSHAFHIDCIDTWLLSNSTCPLCRGTLFSPGLSIDNPIFEFEDSREEDGLSTHGEGTGGVSSVHKPAENEIMCGKMVFSVRLGKFKSSNEPENVRSEVGETSSSNLDARRCFSMGSYQYVVADSELQVTLRPSRGGAGSASMRLLKGRGGPNGNSIIDGDTEGKRINLGSKGESFSVSKIWQWSRKGKFPSSSETYTAARGLPWTNRNQIP